jgi:sulfatase maturation enzyme AslB (radical SAM superfamily)
MGKKLIIINGVEHRAEVIGQLALLGTQKTSYQLVHIASGRTVKHIIRDLRDGIGLANRLIASVNFDAVIEAGCWEGSEAQKRAKIILDKWSVDAEGYYDLYLDSVYQILRQTPTDLSILGIHAEVRRIYANPDSKKTTESVRVLKSRGMLIEYPGSGFNPTYFNLKEEYKKGSPYDDSYDQDIDFANL